MKADIGRGYIRRVALIALAGTAMALTVSVAQAQSIGVAWWGEGDQKALTIGRGNLSSLCRAVNVLTPKDSDELKAKPFRVKVTVKKSEEYGAQNNIAAYKPRTVQPGFSPPAAPLAPCPLRGARR